MTRHAGDGVGIEKVLRRQFHTAVFGRQLVRESDAVRDLRTEFKPPEIEIHTETDLAEIVHHVKQHRFLTVTTHVETRTTACNDVRPVVTFAFGTPLEVQRQVHRHGQHIGLGAVARRTLHGMTALGLITDRATRELHTRTET